MWNKRLGRSAWKSALVVFVVIAGHATATLYQVGPTESYPDLFSVAPLLAPGDVVQVDGNVTYPGGVVFSNNGAVGNPITIQGISVNGTRPVLAQTTGFSGTGGAVVQFTGSHYVMEGFDITQAGDPNAGAAFSSSGDDITLLDSAVHDCTVSGIVSSAAAGSLTLEYVEVYNCGSGAGGNQIYAQSDLSAYPAAFFHMAFCYVHNGGGGDNVKSRVPRTEIYYNWIEGAPLNELDLDGADPSAQAPGAVSLVEWSTDVVGNVLMKDPGSKGFAANIGDSIGWTDGLCRFVNNTAVLSASSAVANPVVFQLTDSVQSVEVYNNLFYGAGGGSISVLSTAKLFTGSACAIVGSNNWAPLGSTGIPTTWTNTFTGPDPQVVNLAANNFTPLAGGALAGAGATLTSDPPGLPFPSPLAAPLFLPPMQNAYALNAAPPRVADTPIDIGAFGVPAIPFPGYTPPVALNVPVQLANHLPITIPVLANDTDSTGAPLSVEAVGTAAYGSASISGTNVVYTLSPNFPSTDSFTYSISDGYGVASASVTVSYAGPTLYQVGPAEQYPDLGSVAPMVMPGDLVQVDGNATYPGGVTFKNSGTPQNKIIIQGIRINGKRPALAGTAGFQGAGAFVVRFWGSHYVMEGFDLTTGSNPNAWRGLYNVADDVTLADSVVHDCPCDGISNSDSAGSLSLQYDEVYQCGAGTQAHQIYAGSSNTLYPNAVLDIEYCYLHNGSGGNNIKSRVARTQVYYNWIEGAYFHEFDLDGADPSDQAPGTARLINEVADVVGNVIVKDASSHGLVANVGGDGTGWSDGRYRFVNNTIILPSSPTDDEMIFQLKNEVQSIEIYNNLIYRFGGKPVNILDEVDWYLTSPATVIGSNNWIPQGSAYVPMALTNTFVGVNPEVVNAAAFNFTPLAGGVLAGAGAAAMPDPAGMVFPCPLAEPIFLPPVQAVYAMGAAVPRAMNTPPIDIGAFAVTQEPPMLVSSSTPENTGTSEAVSLTVNPSGLDTTVSIQYGLTTAYTGGTTAAQDIGSGFEPVVVTPDLTGLAFNMTYHYCIVATNALGTVCGPDEVFTTGPVFTAGAALVTGTSVKLGASVDPNGIAGPSNDPANVHVFWQYGLAAGSYTQETVAQPIGTGTSTMPVSFIMANGPGSGLALAIYHCQLVISTAYGDVYGPDQTFTTGPAYTAGAAEAGGTSVTLNASVNPNGLAGPSTNKTNVLVSWQYGTGLVSGSYNNVTTSQPIGTGTAAVAVSLTIARSAFSVGVYNCRLLISSTLGNIYGPNEMFSVEQPTVDYSPPVATGTDATLSLTVNPNGLDTTVTIVYGLTTAYTSGTIPIGDIGSGLTPVSVDADLTGLATNTAYHYRVVTTTILGTVYGPDQVFATQPEFGTAAVAWTAEAATGIAGAAFSAFGSPAINNLDHAAFQAVITGSAGSGVGTTNYSGIWAGIGTSGRILIARTGTPAPGYASEPGVTTGTFATLSDPAYSNHDGIAFLGTLVTGTKPTSLNNTNNTGIWATTSGTLALVARAGDLAPDATGMAAAGGPVFASFAQFVLPDQGGVVLLATLVTGTGGVVASNNQGIWAVDTDGLLKQVLRTGEALAVRGSTKIIYAISIFNAPAASTGQTRHFNNAGDLVYTVMFTDRSTSIVQSVFP